MLALLAVALLAQTDPGSPEGPIFSRGGRKPPAFAFAPASGVGMGSACACTAVTGTKGEAVTFTRASSGTCLKGDITTGVANGDLVTCSSDQPRVGTGGSGSLKLLMEESRTNTFLRSNEFNNAAWVKLGQAGSAPPAVTADQAVAPDGTTTADEITFDAATNLQRSVIYQIATFSGAGSVSVFIKGKTTGGTVDVCATSVTCFACVYTTTAWALCRSQNGTQVSGGTTPFIGNAGQDTGITRPAQTVYIAMANFEAGTYASSYIATAGVAATRVIEAASVTIPAGLVNTAGSFAATIVRSSDLGGGGLAAFSSSNRLLYNPDLTSRIFDSTTVVQTTNAANWTSPHRLWSSWSGATMSVNNSTDGLSASGAFDGDMMAGNTAMELGCNAAGAGPLNGWIGDVCLDQSLTRCK